VNGLHEEHGRTVEEQGVINRIIGCIVPVFVAHFLDIEGVPAQCLDGRSDQDPLGVLLGHAVALSTKARDAVGNLPEGGGNRTPQLCGGKGKWHENEQLLRHPDSAREGPSRWHGADSCNRCHLMMGAGSNSA
jgi:hypothetical protein